MGETSNVSKTEQESMFYASFSMVLQKSPSQGFSEQIQLVG